MRWTTTKKLVENLICEKLKNRISIYSTSYRNDRGDQRRIWITLDNKEIFNASSAQYLMEHDKLWEEINNRSSKSYPDSLYECFPEFVGKVSYGEFSNYILEQRNIFNVDYVYDILTRYPNYSIEDVLTSKSVIVQSLGMLDIRIGKRTLKNLDIHFETHPLIQKFYQIRCNVEEI
ncbi:hypothetical protein RAH41_02495 [Gottfriedia acidiceleris]|uniref:SF0329 family protein n=1 Tax=Gottfriedia acidiceleris TaxID=371036 RepID=UPI002F26B75D